jgi:hypothetical protein
MLIISNKLLLSTFDRRYIAYFAPRRKSRWKDTVSNRSPRAEGQEGGDATEERPTVQNAKLPETS